MRNRLLVLPAITIAFMIPASVSTTSPRFYGDDPLPREPESQNAKAAEVSEIGNLFQMVNNLFVNPGYIPSGRRAQNINTIDELPDSS